MKQILCFGDSNTYGLIPGSTDRYDYNIRWTGILDSRLRKRGCRIIDEGLCRRTTIFEDPLREGKKGIELLPVLLETHKPLGAVIIMLGTNDCKTVYDASAEVIGKGIERLLSCIEQSDPNTKILLISPILLGNRVWEEGYDPEFDSRSVGVSRKLPGIYEKIAVKRNIHFMVASQYAEASKTDREHLDENGHRILAEAISEKLNEMLL